MWNDPNQSNVLLDPQQQAQIWGQQLADRQNYYRSILNAGLETPDGYGIDMRDLDKQNQQQTGAIQQAQSQQQTAQNAYNNTQMGGMYDGGVLPKDMFGASTYQTQSPWASTPAPNASMAGYGAGTLGFGGPGFGGLGGLGGWGGPFSNHNPWATG